MTAAPPLIATYRLQLRCGVGLARARDLLPWLQELGVSHLYLAPPFQAASGSTHGYDVIDPTVIDPDIGGDEAFVALSDAARTVGIGIVIDIVPNHMAFTPENQWLADVLRHGRESRYAAVFDIDWDRIHATGARIHFPVLDGSPEDLLEAGQISMAGTAQDPHLRVYDRNYPLRISDLSCDLTKGSRPLTAADLHNILAEQHWSLGHWQGDAALITHRRFFNITDLIGVRQEDPEVFDLTHTWILEQVAAGRVQGLRVDHVDGLARPGCYMRRLREAVGELPVWIEKIVKPGETMPASWPVEGMSGYEFMGPVTRLLTNPEGLDAMRTAAMGAVPASTAQEVRKVRHELLDQVFVPELVRVTDAAMAALAGTQDSRPALSDAIARLATAWPVYRSYTADLAPLSTLVTDAVADVDAPAGALLDLLRAPDDPLARIFAARFEQLTGALTAKSEEDTVFFRSVAYLPFCEVGSEPDLDVIDAAGFETLLSARADQSPLALDALSTHDTKRSADARAVLIALSHFPELAGQFYCDAREQARGAGLPEHWGIYALQTALMLRGQDQATDRITAHVAKAMREAKDLSRHEAPDEAAEQAVTTLALDLHHRLSTEIAPQFDAAVETVVLAQVALQLTAPGIPDIYQGTEGPAVALTDPDNRRPVPWSDMSASGGRKLALTRELLARRRAAPDLFARGSYRLTDRSEVLLVEREWQGESFVFEIPLVASLAGRTRTDEQTLLQ